MATNLLDQFDAFQAFDSALHPLDPGGSLGGSGSVRLISE